jgi:hypothetical protein
MFMYRKIKVSVGVVPMLLAENRIPNTEDLLPAGHHVPSTDNYSLSKA